MTLPTSGRLFLGFGILVALLAINALLIGTYLGTLADRIERVTRVAGPTAAAAYEMEINALEIGWRVSSYLVTRDPSQRERVARDSAEFARFKAQFDRFALSRRRRELGRQIRTLFQEYMDLGQKLMDNENTERTHHQAIASSFKDLGALLEDTTRFSSRATRDGRTKAELMLQMANATHSMGAAFGNYLRTYDPEFRRSIRESTRDFERALSRFQQMRLDPRESRWADDVRTRFGRWAVLIETAMDRQDRERTNVASFLGVHHELDSLLNQEIQPAAERDLGVASGIANREVRSIQVLVLVLFVAGLVIGAATAVTVGAKVVQVEKDHLEARAQAERRASQLALATRALARSNRDLDQFAYVASHDLKAPLRAIANLAHWIEEDLQDRLSAEAREHMKLLQKRVQRMEGLIDGILEYSRAGRGEIAVETVDVRALLREIIDLLEPPEGIAIEVAAMPAMRTARLPLQQVFLNLVGNAVKHAPPSGGRIRISVREEKDAYEFSVADNGPGIAPEYHERIWGIFQTLEARDKTEGTGIGLALVKKIVEEQGGRAWVESAEGQGADFRFTWPRDPSA